jgi:tetratricopeptide (TPR) repeat protein
MPKPAGKKVSTSSAANSSRSISSRTRWLFRLAALLLPVALVLGFEGILRLRGYGGYPLTLRKVGPVDGGTLVLADQAGAISWFFANPERPGYNDQYCFVTPKPTNTFRIFLVGESAMKGYPQPRNLASSAFLQAMLQDAWPERRVEVINLGTTAVASYPVRGMLNEALEYEPDLIIVHTGHNEFFGTYGVASIGQAGGSVWRLGVTRFVHSLAMVQAFEKWRRPKTANGTTRTLMETMVGRDYIAPDDPRRAAAARNLHDNLAAMARACRERSVPVMICTVPSNERDLAPVGRPASEASAPEHFQRGKQLAAEGKDAEALAEFIKARDLDTMPWRATSAAQEAIRRAAREEQALLCDLEASFRTASPGGSVGWELMDDHVHPTLRGQALMAETFVSTLTNLSGKAQLSPAARAKIAPWEEYARRLGDNPYDRYGVAHSMRVLFEVPFMRSSNPEAYERLNSFCTEFERAADAELLAVMREWQTYKPHAGAKRPLSGMVARVLMRQRKFEEARSYFEIARQAVPEYTSWHMEYVYFGLACQEKITGRLTDVGRADALREIEQGKFLLRRGFSETGFTERYVGRLYQLCGDFEAAIPFLNASRQKLSGMELVAADQALIVSYLKTGRRSEAVKLAEYGAAQAGQFAPMYRNLLAELNSQSATNAVALP